MPFFMAIIRKKAAFFAAYWDDLPGGGGKPVASVLPAWLPFGTLPRFSHPGTAKIPTFRGSAPAALAALFMAGGRFSGLPWGFPACILSGLFRGRTAFSSAFGQEITAVF